MPVLIGKITKGEKKIKFHAQIYCITCGKKVPGGMQTGESYYNTVEFKAEFENFKKNYQCGICRDASRTKTK